MLDFAAFSAASTTKNSNLIIHKIIGFPNVNPVYFYFYKVYGWMESSN
jgi:hypothetical protein